MFLVQYPGSLVERKEKEIATSSETDVIGFLSPGVEVFTLYAHI